MADIVEVIGKRTKTGAIRWRWRMTARNGRITDAATQGFTERRSCIKNLRRQYGPVPLVKVASSLWRGAWSR